MELYKKENENFEANGDYNLENITIDYIFDAGINKIWGIEVEIEYDKDNKWTKICEWDVLKCDTPMLKNQFFRIYNIDTSGSNLVVRARLLFYDLSKKIIIDSRNVNSRAQNAIEKALMGTKFQGHSNIATLANCNWIKKNIVNALMGSEEYSFLYNYKGEAWIDNYNISINTRIGGDYGYRCEYGKDIEEIEKTINTDDIYTRIIPYGANNLMLVERYVDSPLINNYPIVLELPVSFDNIKVGTEEGDFATETLAREELKRRALELFNVDNIDKPKVNFKVAIAALENTLEYKGYENLINIGLGDDIVVSYEPLGIDIKSRCIGLKWSGKSKKYIEVEIGNFIETFMDDLNKTSNIAKRADEKINNITDGDRVIAEKIKGFLNMADVNIKASKEIGELQDYTVAYTEVLDKNNVLYGSIMWGTGGIFITTTRTLDNKEWDYSAGTCITPKGIKAENIIGKLLANEDGTNYFDLDAGIIRGTNMTINLTTGVITSHQENGDKIIISPRDGFYRQVGESKKEYHSLIDILSVDTSLGVINGDAKSVTVQLGEEWKGKRFKIMASIQGINAISGGNDYRISTSWCGIDAIDFEKGTFKVVGYTTWTSPTLEPWIKTNHPVVSVIVIA